MSRIDDVLYADSLTRTPSLPESNKCMPLSDSPGAESVKYQNPAEEAPTTTTLSDFIGWNLDEENDTKKNYSSNLNKKLEDEKSTKKLHNVLTHKKISYLEKLEQLGNVRSPTARH